MPDILVKKTRAEPGEASLEVIIPPGNVRAAEERAPKVYQQRARLPGFRQGKSLTTVVPQRFAVLSRPDNLAKLMQECRCRSPKQEERNPWAVPHILNPKWEAGAPV